MKFTVTADVNLNPATLVYSGILTLFESRATDEKRELDFTLCEPFGEGLKLTIREAGETVLTITSGVPEEMDKQIDSFTHSQRGCFILTLDVICAAAEKIHEQYSLIDEELQKAYRTVAIVAEVAGGKVKLVCTKSAEISWQSPPPEVEAFWKNKIPAPAC